MLALSLALQDAGHDVLLAGPPEKAAWARQLGCPFHPLGADVTAVIDGMKDAHSIGAVPVFMSFVRREILSQFQTFPEIISGADMVIGASLVFGLSSVTESMGILYRYVAFTPQLLPSGFHPFFAFKNQRLPRWYNRATWSIAFALDRLNLTHLVNRERKKLGLFPIKNGWLHILGDHVIMASDKDVYQVPGDVKLGFSQTGYMHLEQPDQENPDLEAFLDSGRQPVYAGFGSMPFKDQAANVPMIISAARAAGRRIVIAKFWDGPSEFPDSDDIFFIRKYPHLKLFPRMAAVIHHGGAGTTASCAISGTPQIVVPHILDQYGWGHQVYQAGLGPKPIWRSRLTYANLAEAIREATTNDQIKQTAKAVSAKIDRQRSLEMAVQAIEVGK
jgi:UDP:flavonoid glycosyltransferase YjiC (YdhE family)